MAGVRINVTYLGDLRCEAVHEQSGVKLVTDAPKDNQGKGESFSPTDLVATALGTCMATIMGIVARRDNIDIKGMKIDVEKIMATSPVRLISKVIMKFKMPRAIPEDQRIKLARAAETCPVHKSLGSSTTVDYSFEYPS